jgi:hypothetical protein
VSFSDLPDLGNGLRMVGSMLMDEEQFTVEQWHQDRGEWTCRLPGLAKYAELRRQRREDRKRSWAERNEADEESEAYYSALADAKPGGRP